MASAGTQSIGNTHHEGYTDLLTVIEPTKTPAFSSLPKGKKPTHPLHEWTADNLQDVNTDTVPEGHDVGEWDNAGENRKRLKNFMNLMERTWMVTDVEMESNPAGVDNMAAESKAKKMKEWKRNFAARIMGDFEMADGPNYKCRGMGNWATNSAQTVNPVDALYRTPAASINTTATASLAEADINDVLTSVWTESGDLTNGEVYCGAAFKVGISKFSRQTTANLNYHINQDAESNKITRNVTVFEGDFGLVKFVADQFVGYGGTDNSRKARAYYLNPDYLELNWFIALHHFNGTDEGGGPRGTWKGGATLTVANPLSLAAWKATS